MVADILILDREVYSEPEAARLLGLPASTLSYWLNGAQRRGGKTYPPIIRQEAVETRWVTWAEFIEAGWLSAYRRGKGIPMVELRTFIETLRDETGVPYPLAHFQPLASGRSLILHAQEASGLSPEFQLVHHVGNQYLLSSAAERFVEQVVWADDIATGWKPHRLDSPVVVQPDVRFGRPAVSGVSTATLFEQSEAGASAEELAEDFGLPVNEVRMAVAYELERHSAA